jgi:geranylgeranyl diphosphate synthase, type I
VEPTTLDLTRTDRSQPRHAADFRAGDFRAGDFGTGDFGTGDFRAGDFRVGVARALEQFLDGRAAELTSCSPVLVPAVAALREFLLSGGKRIRPAFCYWGWRGAGGDPDEPAIVHAAASLELLHASGLIHDDIIDASDTRRGRPSVHRRFAALHRDDRLSGSPADFGTSAAILLGDMCLAWCGQMLDESALPPAAVSAARPVFHLMHTEVLTGQYLDLLEQSLPTLSAPRSMNVITYKTARYTVERPLQLGGLLAGAREPLIAAYSRFAQPVGEAFQLRDDVLGVFGDSAQTGKPAGDDLREGKHTVLVVIARQRAGRSQRADLDRLLGNPDLNSSDLHCLRAIITSTGALDAVEDIISDRLALALRVLAEGPLDDATQTGLAELAIAATRRSA